MCYFHDKSPLILSIECTIQSLSIALYFPLIFEENIPLVNQFHINWNANDYVTIWENKVRKWNKHYKY
jgi:hypothetical protein